MKLDNAAFSAWWRGVLARDAAAADHSDTYAELRGPLLCCVFCRKSLKERLRPIARDDGSYHRSAMIAWWGRPYPKNDNEIVAAGLYCLGRDRCLPYAEQVGTLYDWHAEQWTGPRAIFNLERVLFDYARWEPTALRRFVGVMAAMAHVVPGRRLARS